MPTLLQINFVVNSGSTGRIAEEIGRQAISLGWKSYIVYGRERGTQSESEVFNMGDKLDFYCHAMQTRMFDRHGLASKNNTQKLVKFIKEIKPDIIHLHNIHGYYLNYPILFEYLATLTTPIVWTMHDCWSFTGHCAYFDMVGCDRWKSGCFDCPQKSAYPASKLLDRSRQNFKDKCFFFNSLKNLTLVPVSDWLANLTSQSFFKGNRIKRIHNGVDIDIFKPQPEIINFQTRSKYGIGDRFMILGVASVWELRKGLTDFIKLNELIDSNTVVVLVGLTPKQIASIPNGIIGINRTENIRELSNLYSTADLFLNTTYEDNFPTTNLESLACGTPVATYRTGGSVEAITQETGYIVGQGDIDDVIEIVDKIKNKDTLLVTQLCRESAINLFNKNDRYKEYLSLYKTLLNSKI